MLQHQFQVGDWVLVHMPTVVAGHSRKLYNQFGGPCVVRGQHVTATGDVTHNVLDVRNVVTGKFFSVNRPITPYRLTH